MFQCGDPFVLSRPDAERAHVTSSPNIHHARDGTYTGTEQSPQHAEQKVPQEEDNDTGAVEPSFTE